MKEKIMMRVNEAYDWMLWSARTVLVTVGGAMTDIGLKLGRKYFARHFKVEEE